MVARLPPRTATWPWGQGHRWCSCWCCASVQTSLACWRPLQPRRRQNQAAAFGARFPRLTPAQSRAFRELLDLGRVWVAEACGLLDSEGWRSRWGVVLALPGCLAPLRRRPKGEHLCPVGVPGVPTAARRGRGACTSAWVEPEDTRLPKKAPKCQGPRNAASGGGPGGRLTPLAPPAGVCP